MKEKIIVSLFAISGIVILEGIALIKGIDGAIFMSALAIIGGIAGYELKIIKDKIKK